MLWVKAFHIVFVASWFAGLFYLPRIFVNLAMVEPGSVAERERLLLMARKLLRFSFILAVPALALGLALWGFWGIGRGSGWLHGKLLMAVLALAYQVHCAATLRRFGEGGNHRSHVWYRWYNELPLLVFVGGVLLAVLKPA